MLTQKEVNQLNEAKAKVKASWTAACKEAGIPTDSKFVVWTNGSELAKVHNELMSEYFKLRNRIKKNMARRERHAAMTGMELKRVTGAQGGVYYE